jgi:hypothetical protein
MNRKKSVVFAFALSVLAVSCSVKEDRQACPCRLVLHLDAIDTSLLREDEKTQLNEYHKLVFDTVSPYLNDDERTWLKIYTRAI